MTSRPFVLLDRDGTIIREKNYLSDPDNVELVAGAAEGLKMLRGFGCGLVVITNQSGVGRGYFSLERLEAIHHRLIALLEAEGIRLDGIYVCPHAPEEECACRKPRTGLVLQASRDLSFDPGSSFVVGDKPCDIEMGKRIGATTILVRTGYGASFAENGTLSRTRGQSPRACRPASPVGRDPEHLCYHPPHPPMMQPQEAALVEGSPDEIVSDLREAAEMIERRLLTHRIRDCSHETGK